MEAQHCSQRCCEQACVKKNRTMYEKLILKATQYLCSSILFSSPYHLIGLKQQAKRVPSVNKGIPIILLAHEKQILQ